MSHRSERKRRKSALAWGLVTSATLHGALLLVPVAPPARPAAMPTARHVPSGPVIRVLRLRTDRTPVDSRMALRAVEPTVAADPRVVDEGAPGLRPIDGPAVRRSAPRPAGPRIWRVDPALPPLRPDGLTASEHRLERRIAAYHDSVAAATLADLGRRSWTGEDAEGRSWGASPGALHVGGTVLRYCGGTHNDLDCGFGAAPWRLAGFQSRVEQYGAIARQREVVRADRLIGERIRALRERADAGRDSLRGVTR